MANPNSRLLLLRALLIAAAVFWIFSPAFLGGWLWDDDFYLYQNALLNDPARLWKIWFVPGSLIEYYPIEASVQAIQWQLWGNETLGYHLTNVVLHIIGALLFWRLLDKFGLKFAWLGGLLFAIHPVVVESVAWISELKNVLSLPPFLLAMCYWIDYDEHKRPRDYLLALGLFLVAMLCKISMAPFPVVILLYAWWKRGRIGWNDVKASAPFLVISLALGATTILVGIWFREAHLQPTDPAVIGGFLSRLALAGLSISFYFCNCIWPVGLLPNYPKWPVNPPSLWQFFPWPIFIGLFVWFWIRRESWGRHLLLGLGFFLLNILPFAGFQSATYMESTWVMDHFLYLPMLGVLGLVIAGLETANQRLSSSQRPALLGLMTVVMALLAFESHWYAGKFVSQEALWSYTVEHNPGAFLAHNNLGNELFKTGRVSEAIEQYQEALRINPHMAEAHINLGMALNLEGKKEEAIEQYERALKINAHFAMAHVDLGNTLSDLGRTQEAIEHYEEALKVNPDYTEARENLEKLQAQLKSAPPKN